jgi:hypothetical protein
MSKFLSGLFSKKSDSKPPVNLRAISNSGSNMMKTIRADKKNKEHVAFVALLTDINKVLNTSVPNIDVKDEEFEKYCNDLMSDDVFKKTLIKNVCNDVVVLKNKYQFYIDKLKEFNSLALSNESMMNTLINFKTELQSRISKINKVISTVDEYITNHCSKKSQSEFNNFRSNFSRRLNALKGISHTSGGKRKTSKRTKKNRRSKKTLRRK